MPKTKAQENLEQAVHVLMGFGARLIYFDFMLFLRETVVQWPPADDQHPIIYRTRADGTKEAYFPETRVLDMVNDMRSYEIGKYLAEVVRWIVIGVLAVKYF